MTQHDRIYIRFKGRVLGPLTHDKATELVRRGQITKQHELSPDGQSWRPAEEFPELFVTAVRSSVVQNSAEIQLQSPAAEPAALEEQWYAHYDGVNQGPANEATMRQWVALGKIDRETMVWKSGMENWLEAQVVREHWFGIASSNMRQKSRTNSNAEYSVDDQDLALLAKDLLRSNRWAYFTGVSGVVLGTVWTIGSIASFLLVVSRKSNDNSDLGALLVSIYGIAWSVAFLLAAILLLQYASATSALRFRACQSDIRGVLQRLARFWSFCGIATAIWISVTVFLGFLFYILGLKFLL